MKNKFLYILFVVFFFVICDEHIFAAENFFSEGKVKYENKKYEEAKFLFQRNIVFNPKHFISYLYLAKISKEEKNNKELKKNLDTTLLLDPKNEEAIYMLIELEIERSNFSKVKELNDKFLQVCSDLCNKSLVIEEKIKNLEPKNES